MSPASAEVNVGVPNHVASDYAFPESGDAVILGDEALDPEQPLEVFLLVRDRIEGYTPFVLECYVLVRQCSTCNSSYRVGIPYSRLMDATETNSDLTSYNLVTPSENWTLSLKSGSAETLLIL